MVIPQLLCNLTRATPPPKEADFPTVLSALPSYSLGPSLLAIPAATTEKSLALSSVCHVMHGHSIWVCDNQQKPQNSTTPSCNTTCVATQCCTAHHEAHHALGDLHAFLLPSHFRKKLRAAILTSLSGSLCQGLQGIHPQKVVLM